MLHIVKIPNNEGDINNMRKFILGLSFLGFGDIGFLIVFTYTLFHQSIINGSEGWLINLIVERVEKNKFKVDGTMRYFAC